MIDHNLKVIFLHIGKTAGSSIERMINNERRSFKVMDRKQMYGFDPEEGIYLQHASAITTRRMVGNQIFDDYFKFTIVRNPYSRLLSVYHYLLRQHENQYGSFCGYIEALPGIVSNETAQKGSHYISQTHYTHIGDEFICDYVGKFEELPTSILPVQIQLQNNTTLKSHNAHRSVDWGRRSVASYYTPPMRRIMQDIYADDFICFDYSSDPEDIPFSAWKNNIKAAKIALKPYVPARVRTSIRQLFGPLL